MVSAQLDGTGVQRGQEGFGEGELGHDGVGIARIRGGQLREMSKTQDFE